jgi:hypothetical protein
MRRQRRWQGDRLRLCRLHLGLLQQLLQLQLLLLYQRLLLQLQRRLLRLPLLLRHERGARPGRSRRRRRWKPQATSTAPSSRGCVQT